MSTYAIVQPHYNPLHGYVPDVCLWEYFYTNPTKRYIVPERSNGISSVF